MQKHSSRVNSSARRAPKAYPVVDTKRDRKGRSPIKGLRILAKTSFRRKIPVTPSPRRTASEELIYAQHHQPHRFTLKIRTKLPFGASAGTRRQHLQLILMMNRMKSGVVWFTNRRHGPSAMNPSKPQTPPLRTIRPAPAFQAHYQRENVGEPISNKRSGPIS